MRNYPLILLATGAGEHSRGPRGLVEHNGQPWIIHQLRKAASFHCHRAVIVLGPSCKEYFKAVPWMERALDSRVEAQGLELTSVAVDHPELGLFAALQTGARALGSEAPVGAFVLPLEVPVGQMDVWSHLRMHLSGEVAACVPVFQGKAGYPVLLARRYLETLLEMPAESRLDVQLRVLPSAAVQRIEVADPSVCMSINSHDQWLKFVEAESTA